MVGFTRAPINANKTQHSETTIKTMKLKHPFFIHCRLLPAVNVGNATISINEIGSTPSGRTSYRYYIDTPEWEHEGNGLESGVGGGGIQSGMESLLSFLYACGEAYRYKMAYPESEPENLDLFPPNVAEWCYLHSEELSMMELELQENPELVED